VNTLNVTVSSASTLPVSPNRLIGRERELETITTQLRSPEVRLLTLLGTAGVGKTRLAVSVAHDLTPDFEYELYFVGLASISEANLVIPTIARTLGLQNTNTTSFLATLIAYLRERHTFLVLDNFEQVAEAASQLTEVLEACPHLKLLVTSRVRLQLRWERTLWLTPLALPGVHDVALTTLAQTPALKLFVERVQSVTPTFTLTDENAKTVKKLCELLDGLPLALELAAAHANILTPEAMITRWQHHLLSLGWNASDLPARQRTLREAIAWSYTLLSQDEQKLFRQMSVFSGGWTLEAAQAVSRHNDVLAGLMILTNSSLVKVTHEGGQARFHLLESLREYAYEQLETEGEFETTRHDHALYFASLAERGLPAIKGSEQLHWFTRLEQERDNFRAALHWARTHEEGEFFITLFCHLAYFWWTRGYVYEGQPWIRGALAFSNKTSDRVRLKALEGVGWLEGTLGEYDVSIKHLREGLNLAKSLKDANSFLVLLSNLLLVFWLSGRHEEVAPFAGDIETWRENADPWAVAFSLHGLGLLASEVEEQKAAAYLEESLALFRSVNEHYRAVTVMNSLAAVLYNLAEVERSRTLLTEGLEISYRLGNQRAIVFASDSLLFICRNHALSQQVATLLGAVDALRAKISFFRPPKMKVHYQALVAHLQTTLGQETYDRAWTTGRTMPVEQLVTKLLILLETT
jgi:predicted ATPase